MADSSVRRALHSRFVMPLFLSVGACAADIAIIILLCVQDGSTVSACTNTLTHSLGTRTNACVCVPLILNTNAHMCSCLCCEYLCSCVFIYCVPLIEQHTPFAHVEPHPLSRFWSNFYKMPNNERTKNSESEHRRSVGNAIYLTHFRYAHSGRDALAFRT